LLVAVRRTSFLALGLLSVLLACIALPALGQGAKFRVDDDEEMQQGDAPAARENWFRKGRQSPDGLTAAEHLEKAFQQKMEMRRARALRLQSRVRGSASTFVGDANTLWVPMGPAPILPDQFASQDYGPVTGRATSVAVNPADPSGNTVLLGGAFGGAWLSHNAASGDPTSVQWQPVLDQQPSLAVGSVSWSPDGAVMLVGTGEGNNALDSYYGVGFLRSTDAGVTWTQIPYSQDGHGFRGLAIQRMAWSKTAPQVVTASTMFASHGSSASYSNTLQGIYFSTDAGSTWKIAKAYEDANGTVQTAVASSHSIAWNANDHRFYAQLRYHGIYVSRPDDPSSFYRLAAQPDSAGSGTLNDTTTCPGTTGSSSCPMFRGEIAINSKRNEIYVWWIQYPSTHRGVWKSTNGGASWSRLTDTGFTNCGDSSGCGGSQTFFNMTLLAIPNVANNSWTDLFLGGVNLYKCTIDPGTPANAGCGGSSEPFRFMNLTHVYGGTGCIPGASAHVHPDNHDMSAASTGSVYFANDGGVYRTLSSAALNTASCAATQPFDNLNFGMGSMTQFVWGTAIPNDALSMLAGAQDNGTSMTFTGTSGQQWLFTNGGDGGYSDIDPANPTKNWFTSNHDISIQSCTLGTQCNRSNWGSNISTSQDLVDNSDTGGDASSFYAPWMLDPQQSTTLLIGSCRIWRGSTKRASSSTWGGVAISPMLTYSGTCSSSDSNVSTIAAGGPKGVSGSKVVWAALDNGSVWRTLDASVTPLPAWQNVTPSSAPTLPASSLALDSHDSTGMTAYVAYQGFGTAHLWRTTDGGTVWSPAFLNSGLPDAPYNNVIVDPDDGGVIYLATDVGVYACDQTNSNCQEVGPAPNSGNTGFLPNVPVLRIQIQKTTNPTRKLLKAVTYGRGAWMADITAAAGPQAPGTLSISTATVAFDGQPITVSTTLPAVITNTGSGALTVSSISISGSGFTQTNDCGALPISLAPNAGCTVTVAFKAGVTGPSAGTLTIGHNGSNTNPATVALSGAGEDFTTSVAAPSSTNLTAGGTAMFAISASPTSGSFSTNVAFSCSPPLPAGVTCSFSPVNVIPGSTAGQTTLTVSTLKGSVISQHTATANHRSPFLALWLVFPGMLVMVPLRRNRVASFIFTALLLGLFLAMTSCGGGGTSVPHSGAVAVSGTQPGTYQITVVGNAGGLIRTSQVSITVQ
jgi:hypothetical protein